MKKNDYYMMKPLSGEEHVQVSGGYHTGETIESFNAGRDAANAMRNK